MVADCLIADVDGLPYDLIALPGGMPGSERLRDCEPLLELMKQHAALRKPLGALCAAPVVVLQHAGLLDDRTATAHPAFADQLPPGPSTGARVVVDASYDASQSTIVTAQGPGTAIEFALACVELLFGSAQSRATAAPMTLRPALPTNAYPLKPSEWRMP